MAQNDSFTLDKFGSTALSSGLGITAFSGCFDDDPGNDNDPDPTPSAPAPAIPVPAHRTRANFYLDGDRGLAKTWKERARANVAAILIAGEIEKQDRPATRDEQAKLTRFTGFGASELAHGMPGHRPGNADRRELWNRGGRQRRHP